MNKNQNRMLLYFSAGSMAVLFLCLTIAAGFLTFSFLQKEKQRALISRDQVEHFFEFHHTAMSEEMWTGSLQPIAKRVALIANQVGGAQFTLTITDEKGKCLLSQKQSEPSGSCNVSAEFEALIQERISHFSPQAVLRFDENASGYIYMVPLFVGETVRGFLYATLSDPYDFFRGSVVSVTSSTFLPMLAVILFIWVLWLFASREFFLKPYLQYVEEIKADERFAHQARRTAHDLRDPISGLERCLKRLAKSIPPDEQKHMQSFLYQVDDVANSLLNQSSMASRHAADLAPSEPTAIHLLPIIERVISRKKLQYNSKPVEVSYLASKIDWKIFGTVVEMDFERLLSNLINNAVEAIERDGNVAIEMQEHPETIAITIKDTGRGIPKEVLPQIGRKGFTFGKQYGNGLGLYYAKVLVESWGGSLTIESIEGKGTTVCLTIPKEEPPKWFPSELRIQSGSAVVVLDDQPHAHALWENRFKGLGIEVMHFLKASDFLKAPRPSGPVLYLLDHDLKGERQTGIDIIDEFELHESAVLVTNQCDESLRDLCERNGIKLLPKNVAGVVPLIYEGGSPLQQVL